MNFYPTVLKLDEYIHEKKETIDVFGNKRVIVNFYILSNNPEIIFDTSKVKKYLSKLIDLLESYTLNRKEIINIQFYQTDLKKTISDQKKGEITTSNQINSGLCYIYSESEDINIVIFRKEEFYKVLCHEMMHFYDVQPDNTLLNDEVKKLFPSEKIQLRVNESIVELYAIITNCIIVSDLKNLKLGDQINKEYLFSLYQTYKLLDHFGIKEFTCEEINNNWEEDTHTLSYYLLKTFLFNILLNIQEELKVNYKNHGFEDLYKNSLRMSVIDYED